MVLHGPILGPPLFFSLYSLLMWSHPFPQHFNPDDPQSYAVSVNLSRHFCRARDLPDSSLWSITGPHPGHIWNCPSNVFFLSANAHTRTWSLIPFSSLPPDPVWFISKPCHLSLQSVYIESNHCPACPLWPLQSRAPPSLARHGASLVCLPNFTLVPPLFLPHSSQRGLFKF